MGGRSFDSKVIALCAFALAATPGCVRAEPLRYADVLGPGSAPVDLREKLAPPQGACLTRAEAYLGKGGSLLPAPLPPGLRRDAEALLQDLHPVAKRVLERTHGVWYASSIDGAAAVFLTCGVDLEGARGGFVLLDVRQFPFDQPVRDAEVPGLYWRALAGHEAPALGEDDPLLRPSGEIRIAPRDHAARYLVLHELGHALSLLAGEFMLDGHQRMQVRGAKGFTRFSWDIVTMEASALPAAGSTSTVSAVLPRIGLDLMTWGTILDVIGADPDSLVPGYTLARPRRSDAARARHVCAGAVALTAAGFVTPTAARYPTEDYAEMFTHAILADEGKLRPQDRIVVGLPGCGLRALPSPYFSEAVAPKRAYLERVLGLQ
jgi:hypothetical protein